MKNYTIGSFSMKDLIDNNKIVIPNFQRGLVWDKNRKFEFVKTIVEGDPFGVILVYEYIDGETKRFELVDGLQRVSTLREFYRNPVNILKKDLFDSKLIEKIVSRIFSTVGKNQIKHINAIYNILTENYSSEKKASELVELIQSKYEIKQFDLVPLMKEIEDLIDNAKITASLTSLEVPTIVYTGERSRLPSVFERLNSGAVNLSKYEVLAASWSEKQIQIVDEDLYDKIYRKYKSLESKSGLEVKFDEDELKNNLNLFEYCYALGALLQDKDKGSTNIFGKKKDNETVSIGFEILALLSNNQINEVIKLKDLINPNDGQFLINLKKSILETTKKLDKKLKDWITFPNTSGALNVLTGYQAIHLFISFYKAHYIVSFEDKTVINQTNKDYIKKFDKYGKYTILQDCITSYWSQNRQVSDLSKHLNDNELLNRYTHQIPKNDLISNIDNWINSQNSGVRKNIVVENRLFLLYIHRLNSLYTQDYHSNFGQSKFDVEHISPVKRIKDIDDIPLSSIANLCLLPIYDNRIKKEKTIYEDVSRFKTFESNSELLTYLVYPTKGELNFLNYPKAQVKTEYFKFLKNRQNTLTNYFSSLYTKDMSNS